MTEPDDTPDASADPEDKAAATESYGGVPVSDQELAQAWESDPPADSGGSAAS